MPGCLAHLPWPMRLSAVRRVSDAPSHHYHPGLRRILSRSKQLKNGRMDPMMMALTFRPWAAVMPPLFLLNILSMNS